MVYFLRDLQTSWANNSKFVRFKNTKFSGYCYAIFQGITTQFFIMKNTNKQLEQIAHNHSSDIDFKGFMNLYKKYTAKPYSFLVIDATLASDNPLRFRKNLLKRI